MEHVGHTVSAVEGLDRRGMEFGVMLVDDELADLRCLERLIRTAVLIRCRSGAEARTAFVDRARRLSGAIVDVRLSDDNGIDLVAWMRDVGSSIPVLVVSGQYLDADDRSRIAHLEATFEHKVVTSRRIERLVIEAAMTCVGCPATRNAATLIALGRGNDDPPFGSRTDFADRLSVSEARVFGHLADGIPRDDMSDVLERSKKTIERHLEAILKKTRMTNTSRLLSYVLRVASCGRLDAE